MLNTDQGDALSHDGCFLASRSVATSRGIIPSNGPFTVWESENENDFAWRIVFVPNFQAQSVLLCIL